MTKEIKSVAICTSIKDILAALPKKEPSTTLKVGDSVKAANSKAKFKDSPVGVIKGIRLALDGRDLAKVDFPDKKGVVLPIEELVHVPLGNLP